jgi:hypothetical protein
MSATEPIFTTPLKTFRLFNILRVEKIPTGTMSIASEQINARPTLGEAWKFFPRNPRLNSRNLR